MIPVQRHLFDIPEDVAYLNCAYMGPLMKSVAAAAEEGARRKAQPWTIKPADFFETPERVRGLVAQLMNATADHIAIVPSASYGLAVAAKNLPVKAGEEIVLAADQFPSNRHIWAKIAAETGARLVLADGEDLTEAFVSCINERTSIVAAAACRWTDGRKIDLLEVSKACRQNNAALVLDLTQSLGAQPFSVSGIDPDFVIAATYKWLLGPYSCGVLYVADRHFDGEPLEEGWMNRAGAENFANLVDYSDTYRAGARRFDMGEVANFAALPAVASALAQINDWSVDNLYSTLSQRNLYLVERAKGLGLVPVSEIERAGHFLTLGLQDSAPADLVQRLASDNVYVSQRGRSLRITPHVWTTPSDEDRLFKALERHI
ncbi:aminotransferase, class V [Roseibium sp. TrichSKD4]|uniref:aminotransferase class V-fold PLP-dependent enzyme n=1 Tax=Roseibium sp. TrichSKD4 TaxID=744980 RepID=UPI0001E56144|nr:aminotransferase class V-fold PLP-dependent enzyme [Roseibium sp. TrichSKD4]EFO33710.1 aminotransferase, class V [Roseibium sp. TrichSKD4]